MTQEDEQTLLINIYAFDEQGNYGHCETYILVQHSFGCETPPPMYNGVIATEDGDLIEGVAVTLQGSDTVQVTTNGDGVFFYIGDNLGEMITITPFFDENPLNGVSTFDLVLISKHILGNQPLNSPYKRIAADVNKSGTITVIDMILIRKLLLQIDETFVNNTSWRFIPADYTFPIPGNPWFEMFPEEIQQEDTSLGYLGADFIGVKIGDVNGSVQTHAITLPVSE
ncbi:MAG: dockerin type I domain-containing protein [Saprospiraceae bacterium]